MLNAINNITPIEVFTVLTGIIALVGGQLFSSLHRIERRADDQDVRIVEMQMLGVQHNNWPADIVISGLKETLDRRGENSAGIIEQLLKRGEP